MDLVQKILDVTRPHLIFVVVENILPQSIMRVVNNVYIINDMKNARRTSFIPVDVLVEASNKLL